MLRFLTAGESHGKSLVAIIEGLPAGLNIDVEEINRELKKRQLGYGRSKRMEIEEDKVEIISGVRGGITLGTPITLIIENKDWVNWESIMGVTKEVLSLSLCKERELICPRPGHADLAGGIKYNQTDLRNVLERASARETAVRTAVGVIAKLLLKEFGISITSQVLQIGKERDEKKFKQEIDKAKKEGDSLGGIFEIRVNNPPIGLGSFVHWDKRLDGNLARGLMSIPAIKGIEIGIGFKGANLPGSQVHDEIFYSSSQGFYRKTNWAGGLEGGVTNGEPIIVRCAMKPIPTLKRGLRSINIKTKGPSIASYERSDICAVFSAALIGEAVVAIELTRSLQEKFGGDSLEEMKQNYKNYQKMIKLKWNI
ncbi:MAG: chorismate synthase [bacterium]|nr:chorismate synthase [bacterium]